jgi:hypothetical protein
LKDAELKEKLKTAQSMMDQNQTSMPEEAQIKNDFVENYIGWKNYLNDDREKPHLDSKYQLRSILSKFISSQ